MIVFFVGCQDQWLASVEASCLQVHVNAYFGSVKLRSRLSMGKAVTTSISKDNYGNTIYEVHFYEDKFVFDNLDISELDVERELGAFPYAIVRVEYRKPGPEALSECCHLYVSFLCVYCGII